MIRQMEVNKDSLRFLECCAQKWEGLHERQDKAVFAFEQTIIRKVPYQTPETSLICAVITQAARDAISDARKSAIKRDSRRRNKRDGIKFFTDGRLESVCSAIGLDDDFVVEMFEKLQSRYPIFSL